MKPIAYREQSTKQFAEAHRSGLVENPCLQCRGEGSCLHADDSRNPESREYVDECEECGGSGNGICPGCDELNAFLVAGDGRCEACIGFNAVDQVEGLEADERDEEDDGRAAEPDYDSSWVADFNASQRGVAA